MQAFDFVLQRADLIPQLRDLLARFGVAVSQPFFKFGYGSNNDPQKHGEQNYPQKPIHLSYPRPSGDYCHQN